MTPEISELLVDLARSLQRFGMYPEGHPAREDTAGKVCRRLEVVFQSRDMLRLNIATDRLEVDGVQTDPGNNVLVNLASRLYQHQLLSVDLEPGVQEPEIAALLSALAVPVGAMGEPLGAQPEDPLNRWPHVRLKAVPYDALSFSTGAPAGAESGTDAGVPTSEFGTGVVEGPEVAAADGIVVGGVDIEAAAPSLPAAQEQMTESLREQISRLILKLDPDMLREVVRNVKDSAPPDGSEDYVAKAVSELLEAAEDGTLSAASAELVKLLTKMGIHGGDIADDPPLEPATSASLGELVRELGGRWNLPNPNPAPYTETLEALSERAPRLGRQPVWFEEPEPERLIQMSLELGTVGPPAEKAVAGMLAAGRLGELISLLEGAPSESESLDAIWGWVATPATVLKLLRSDPPDFSTLDRLMPRLEMASAQPMFEVLSESESVSGSEAIIDRIIRLGAGTAVMAVERLHDERWHCRRNMLLLLLRFSAPPAGFTPLEHLVDPDARVRREAMRLGLAGWADMEAVMVAAVEDEDQQIITLGLEAAHENCPPMLVPYLITMVHNDKAAVTLRVGAIRALGGSGSADALPALLRLTWVNKFFFIKGLADKSSEVLEALAVIAGTWSEEPRTRKVLKAARKSRDAQVRAVAQKAGTAA